jgi:hypothetical protein
MRDARKVEVKKKRGRNVGRVSEMRARSCIVRVARIGGHGVAHCWLPEVVEVQRFANNCLCGKYKSFGMD